MRSFCQDCRLQHCSGGLSTFPFGMRPFPDAVPERLCSGSADCAVCGPSWSGICASVVNRQRPAGKRQPNVERSPHLHRAACCHGRQQRSEPATSESSLLQMLTKLPILQVRLSRQVRLHRVRQHTSRGETSWLGIRRAHYWSSMTIDTSRPQWPTI